MHTTWNRITRLVSLPLPLALLLTGALSCGDPNEDSLMRDDATPTNRLIHEKSPYLLQHAHNPVDWYPWGEEAFEAAQRLDRPIFLSIGYSTCHWCHVMEHESFEDSTVAALMNEAFINIKVDREERPDIDDVYMTVCQALTNSGGWPLTIIMTPDRRPFFAATYLPKQGRFGRPGMVELIPRIQELWATQREALLADAEKITQHLQSVATGAPGETLGASVLDEARTQLAGRYDSKHGGFAEQPKFPTPHNLLFLLRQYRRTGDTATLAMVDKTLTAMRHGGIFDQIGFGFHRYSTDAQWLVPHFEKMLYDQAMLCMAYVEAYQITGARGHADTVREILTYVLRDMTGPEGGFFSAEDADSEGEEGKFYVWTLDEVRAVLDERSAERFIEVFQLTAEGNFHEETTRQQTGANIPHRRRPIADLAQVYQLPEDTFRDWLDASRKRLFEAREKRVHPLKDDKVLTDWNGLMIAAMARAGRVLGEPEYLAAAGRAADFVLSALRDDAGRLLHRYRDGETIGPAYLDDYAFMIWGLLELYQAGFSTPYLQAAGELMAQAEAHFWDEGGGAFFFTPDDGEALLVRQKTFYDGAIPSGNSVMMLNLLRLARITGEARYETMAERCGQAFAGQVRRYPSGFTFMMCALDFAIGPSREIVLVGDPGDPQFDALRNYLDVAYLPNAVVLHRSGRGIGKALGQMAPFARDMGLVDGGAAAYVCRNQACELPTGNLDTVRELLDDPPTPDRR